VDFEGSLFVDHQNVIFAFDKQDQLIHQARMSMARI
jgi:hypothetical protein